MTAWETAVARDEAIDAFARAMEEIARFPGNALETLAELRNAMTPLILLAEEVAAEPTYETAMDACDSIPRVQGLAARLEAEIRIALEALYEARTYAEHAPDERLAHWSAIAPKEHHPRWPWY